MSRIWKWLAATVALLLILLVPQTAQALSGTCTSPYGWRTNPIYKLPQFHSGIDIAVDMETPVPAAVSGTVTDYIGDQDPGGYGTVVAVEADDGSGTLLYAHLDSVSVSAGDHVSAGQEIGLSGSSGASTGPHLHIGYAPVGLNFYMWDDPMTVLAGSSHYSISGETSVSTGTDYIQSLIPEIDINFTSYFSPSEKLEEMTNLVLEKIVPVFNLAQENLMGFIALLASLDLMIFTMKRYLQKQDMNLMDLVLRVMRYSFFFMLCYSWSSIVDNVFFPMLENISSTVTGETLSESEFLHFDALFTCVANVINPFLHVDLRFGFLGIVIVSLLVLAILFFTMVLTFYMMYKLVVFYIMCAFGVLGVPMLMFDKTRRSGAAMISSIFCTIFDLILTVFLYTFVMSILKDYGTLDESIAYLAAFTGGWGVIVFMFPKISNNMMHTFSSLWDGWNSSPLGR